MEIIRLEVLSRPDRSILRDVVYCQHLMTPASDDPSQADRESRDWKEPPPAPKAEGALGQAVLGCWGDLGSRSEMGVIGRSKVA